jgi:hypothetical protein
MSVNLLVYNRMGWIWLAGGLSLASVLYTCVSYNVNDSSMNPGIITTITAVAASLVAIWTIMANFDKRNQDRFDSLQKQNDNTRDSLQKEIQGVKELLRAEMREMRAEIRLEIKESADRRLIGK